MIKLVSHFTILGWIRADLNVQNAVTILRFRHVVDFSICCDKLCVQYVNIYIYIYTYVGIYIYIFVEREREILTF